MTEREFRSFLERTSKSVQSLNRHLSRIETAVSAPGPQAPVRKRIRQCSKPLSNNLEKEFGEHLLRMYPSNVFWEQAITFRLANGATYTPDWIMYDVQSFSFSCFEVKGKHMWDDAIVKLKVAASQYKQMYWFLVWKENGVWQSQALYP